MDLKEIRQIIEMMKRNDLSLFHLEREGFKIKLRKGVDFDTMVDKLGGSGMMMAAPHTAPVAHAEPSSSTASESRDPELSETAASGSSRILSPMVGTFYRAAGPGEKIFASVGDTITEGTTVCIIEAMKVMNEIQSEISGTVVECLVANGTSVEFGQPLFRVKVS